MSKSIKLKDNNYWDSSSITHEKETLSNFLNNKVMKFKTLWTNSKPTSNFANQTITLYSSDYDYLLINFISNTSGGEGSSIIIKKAQNACLRYLTYTRMITYNSDTSISFGDGYLNSETRNWLNVPIEIIGIKL